MYDIMIVGAGPAGATLARLLSDHCRVLLVDRRDPGNAAQGKCCGGLLSPDAQQALAAQGLTLPKAVLCDPQIFAVDTWDLACALHRRYPRHYLNLHRHAFDAWLRQCIPASVTQCTAAVTGITREAHGFCLEAGGQSYFGRYLVGADGASSIVRRTFFAHHTIPCFTAIQQVFDDPSPAPAYRCLFHRPSTPLCGWSISKDHQLILGGAFPSAHSRAHFHAFRAAFEQTFGTLPPPLRTEACQVYRPLRPKHLCLGSNGVFLVGEAAGFISPSSMEGISFALRSAEILARALRQPHPERAYRRHTRPLVLKVLSKGLKCPWMYVPFLRRWVMRSGLTAQ